jgi:hypothetical protein
VEPWFTTKLTATGLADLAKTGHLHLDKHLITAFVERWYDETSSFHLPMGEITVTLDDVSCLLHLPNGSGLLEHQSLNRVDGIDLMVRHLGSDPGDAGGQFLFPPPCFFSPPSTQKEIGKYVSKFFSNVNFSKIYT